MSHYCRYDEIDLWITWICRLFMPVIDIPTACVCLGSGTRVKIMSFVVWLNIDMHASTGMHRHICNDVIIGVVISCHQFKASSVADCSCRLVH